MKELKWYSDANIGNKETDIFMMWEVLNIEIIHNLKLNFHCP